MQDLVLTIEENKNPDATTSILISQWICGQIEKRVPFRRNEDGYTESV